MPISQIITDLPTPPSSSDAANFIARADAHVASLDNFVDELNVFRTEANALETNVNSKEASAVAAANAAQVSADEVGDWSVAAPYSVSTIADLATIDTSIYKVAHVKDLNRGGIFVWSSTGTANSGTIFSGTTGYWNRQYSGAVNVKWFGAVGDGITDDTSIFATIETNCTAQIVDLDYSTYSVTLVPTKNIYINGRFDENGFLKEKVSAVTYTQTLPTFSPFGGQLADLKNDLTDPLCQKVGMVFLGDSITWGRTLVDGATISPQTSLLDTARNNSESNSFVNLFRKHIGANYCNGYTKTVSNWAASPSGEAIVTYDKDHLMYPYKSPFSLTVTGLSQSSTSTARSTSPTGFMLNLADGAPGGSNYQTVSFNFTGDEFTLIFRCTNTGDWTYYRVIVDGVEIGTYSTQEGVGGFVPGDNNRRTHNFGYVRNKTVEIRTDSTGLTGIRRMYLEGIEVNKQVKITNQGVIGQTARTYDLYNLSGSYSSPTAVTAEDQHIFVQFGTNDRGIDSAVPTGQAEFQRAMNQILDRVVPLGNTIVMCASPVSTTSDASGSFTMQETRGVLYRVSKERNLDFIDNYSALKSIDYSSVLSGDVHPNELGHQLIASNIIAALEQSR